MWGEKMQLEYNAKMQNKNIPKKGEIVAMKMQ
jgi:hypothetical protein